MSKTQMFKNWRRTAVCAWLIVLPSCQTAEAESSDGKLSQAQLDEYFLQEFEYLVQQRQLGDYKNYNHCCVVLGEEISAVSYAIADFKTRDYGSISQFGIAIGRSGSKVLVNLEPRYIVEEEYPYYAKENVIGYVYVVDLNSGRILDFYAKP